MPARTTLSPTDGETTPVAHNFAPHGDVANGVAAYRYLNSTNVGASEMLTIGWRDSLSKPEDYQIPGKAVSPRKWTVKVTMPKTYVDSTSGLTLIARVNTAKYEGLFHPAATAQECKNMRYIMGNLLFSTLPHATESHDLGIPIW